MGYAASCLSQFNPVYLKLYRVQECGEQEKEFLIQSMGLNLTNFSFLISKDLKVLIVIVPLYSSLETNYVL